jgi:hypothetical protein
VAVDAEGGGFRQNTVTTPTKAVHREKPRDGPELAKSRQLALREQAISIDGLAQSMDLVTCLSLSMPS